jgi:hypothetical protein
MSSSWAYQAGTAGTVTVPAGCVITHVRAQSSLANGTVAIFGGTAIPIVGAAAPDTKGIDLVFPSPSDPGRPDRFVAPQSVAGATDIVFTNTVSYFVGYFRR